MLQTNTKIRNGVRLVRIAKIEPDGIEDVYNMEVVGNHNFSVFNGIIVHNCMDDIRYFCATVLRRELRNIPEFRGMQDD